MTRLDLTLFMVYMLTILTNILVEGRRFSACRTSADQVVSMRKNGTYPSYCSFCGSLRDKQNQLIKRFQGGSNQVVFSITQNNVTYWINSSQKLVSGVQADSSENMRDVLLAQGLEGIKKRWLAAVATKRPSKIHPDTLRMILSLLSNELMDPRNHLFTSAAAPRNRHMSRNSIYEIERFPHQASHAGYASPKLFGECGGKATGDLYLKSIGHVIGVALLNKQFLDVSFTSSFYKFILGMPIDMYDVRHVNPQLYLELKSILEFNMSANRILRKSGLVINGTYVTDDNKHQYVESAVDKFIKSHIAPVMNALCAGLYEIIPKEAFAMFNEKELEVLISGNTEIDTGNWRRYTSHEALLFSSNRQSLEWFWRMVNEWDMDMRSRLLLFVTGTSRLPINGFKEGYRIFTLSSWFNIDYLDYKPDGQPKANPKTHILYLPKYSSYEMLESKFYAAVRLNGGVSTWYKFTGYLRYMQN